MARKYYLESVNVKDRKYRVYTSLMQGKHQYREAKQIVDETIETEEDFYFYEEEFEYALAA